MELENIKKIIEYLECQGFDIFYTKSNDAESVKIYEERYTSAVYARNIENVYETL